MKIGNTTQIQFILEITISHVSNIMNNNMVCSDKGNCLLTMLDNRLGSYFLKLLFFSLNMYHINLKNISFIL